MQGPAEPGFHERMERLIQQRSEDEARRRAERKRASEMFEQGARRAAERDREMESEERVRQAAQSSECCNDRLLRTDAGYYCTACGRPQ